MNNIRIENQLQQTQIQQKVKDYEEVLNKEVCSNIPNALV